MGLFDLILRYEQGDTNGDPFKLTNKADMYV